MNRAQALDHIQTIAVNNVLTEQEVVNAYRQSATDVTASGRPLNFSEITSFIGSIIVVAGIAVLIGGSWGSLSVGTKIFATLGVGIIFYVLGLVLEGKERARTLATSLQFIAAAVLPSGLLVTLQIGGFSVHSPYYQLIPALLLTATYAATWYTHKKPLYLFFTIVYATWAYLIVAAIILSNMSIESAWSYFLYAPAAAGLAYICFGRYFAESDQRGLTGPLYGFGALAALGFCFGLVVPPSTNHVWEVLYPLLIVGCMYLSVVWKVRIFLIFSIVATLGYLISMTAKYFVGTLGWPLALVLIGIIMIWVGSFGAKLNRQMFTKKRPASPMV